jgi:biotin synthase
MNSNKLLRTLNAVYKEKYPDINDLVYLLERNEPAEIESILGFADKIRQKFIGSGIFLRGVIEISNHCRNACLYCGLNKNNKRLERYRLNRKEILSSINKLWSQNIKTVVIQAGEDEKLDPEWVSKLIIKIKKNYYGIAVTLSLGEYKKDVFKLWKQSGADRYLLKIETSNKTLYESLHPDMSYDNRIKCLNNLKELGYETGSGNIIGLRGQTSYTIAGDIIFFVKNKFEMIGIGPFIPHYNTELHDIKPGNVMMTLKTVALTRIVTKYANIPATSSLGSVGRMDYRVKGLMAGANVLMPNFTPQPYRKLYEIYPNKKCIDEPVGACAFCMEGMAKSIGRYIDYSKGDNLGNKLKIIT